MLGGPPGLPISPCSPVAGRSAGLPVLNGVQINKARPTSERLWPSREGTSCACTEPGDTRACGLHLQKWGKGRETTSTGGLAVQRPGGRVSRGTLRTGSGEGLQVEESTYTQPWERGVTKQSNGKKCPARGPVGREGRGKEGKPPEMETFRNGSVKDRPAASLSFCDNLS